ncbi:MAG: GTPase Era [Gammaproteobacteria bacterium]
MLAEDFRCGYAAIVGRPNVGKSTLLNALLGEKLSIVTPRPQTTRHRILGILTTSRAQILFIDTPGLHRSRPRAMHRLMNRTAASSLADADVALMVIEALAWTEEDEAVLRRIADSNVEALLVVNKCDRIAPKSRLLPFLEQVAARGSFSEIVPASALEGTNLEVLPGLIVDRLPHAPALFPAEQLTDRSMRFIAAEIIREKLMRRLRDELPYGLSVQIERYEEAPKGVLIGAVIWVERPGQKAIVIGEGGKLLKEAGRAARLDLKARLERPVRIELWVKVRENWSDSERALREFGYGDPSDHVP